MIVSGLLCLCLWVASAPGTNLSQSDLLSAVWDSPRVFETAQDTGVLASVEARLRYDDLVHSRTAQAGSLSRQIYAEDLRTSLAWLYRGTSWGIRVHASRHTYAFSWLNGADDFRLSSGQNMGDAGLTLWSHGERLSAGLFVSGAYGDRLSPDYGSVELSADAPAQAAAVPTVNRAFFLEARNGVFSGRVDASHFLNNASVTRLTRVSDGHFRTFPLAASTARYAATLGFSGLRLQCSLSGAIQSIGSDTVIHDENQMPCEVEGTLGTVELGGNARPGRLTLDWKAWYRAGTLRADGFDAADFNFASLDSVVCTTGGLTIDASLPREISVGLRAEALEMEGATGFLSTSVFSSWAVFDPKKYRFVSGEAHWYEAGVHAGKNWRIGRRHQVQPTAVLSYVDGSASTRMKERRIAVLIPYYADEKQVGAGISAFVVGLSLDYRLSLGRLVLISAVSQRIPVSTGSSASRTSASPSVRLPKGKTRTRGATAYCLNLVYTL